MDWIEFNTLSNELSLISLQNYFALLNLLILAYILLYNEASKRWVLENPTPVSRKSIPKYLKMKDVLLVPQTGTGKLLHFIAIIHKIVSGEGGNLNTKSLLQPPRELAQQNRQQWKV